VSHVPRTLFVGRGRSAVSWYRCALPALALGCDWIGVRGAPPEATVVTGSVPGFSLDAVAGYEVVVLQQVGGGAWLRAIRDWRSRGVTVLYEVDDWLRGVGDVVDHARRADFDPAVVEAHERCMAATDGVICSTDWLARRCRSINPRTWTCRNGLDLPRYRLTRPHRDHVGIGWAGGTGHRAAVTAWLPEVADVMRDHAATRFVSVGEPFAAELGQELGGERCLAIPFGALDVYPAAMTHFDVALAPAGRSAYFQAKSDLRWLEAGALGIPTIADPAVYPEIEHGVTGFHAATPAQAGAVLRELVADGALRDRVGAAARAHVREHRSSESAARAWEAVLREASPASVLSR
jgi:O-antigen biosynthesis protein